MGPQSRLAQKIKMFQMVFEIVETQYIASLFFYIKLLELSKIILTFASIIVVYYG